jgi:wobble nucleotide-excising tRNase
MASTIHRKADLTEVANYLRGLDKKYTLLFGYNGTGKTRLSMDFRQAGKTFDDDGQVTDRDTLYYNAYTEDLFTWDNDLYYDTHRVLLLNKDSQFFAGIEQQDMENKIRPILHRYADFNFLIDYKYKKKNDKGEDDGPEFWAVNFIREALVEETAQNVEHIKISRGEENIFIWCFFLAVAQLAIDKQVGYEWVKYIYIDDPISSLDDNNAVAVASHLAHLITNKESDIKFVLSSHHSLFYNVMWNELGLERKKFQPYFLAKDKNTQEYTLQYTRDTPFFHHVALLKELKRISETGTLFTYHFSLLRNILERTATFHGFNNFSACIKKDEENDPDGIIHARLINVLSHGNYLMFEPTEMIDENKEYFKIILDDFMNNYRFNPELFAEPTEENTAL